MNGIPPLEAEVRRLIARDGPMPLARYMALCLSHPDHGYYRTRHPFGRAGDFTTAPEISQMFGELVGVWAAAVWQQMGSPDTVRLIELGPGRGTMMADMLRAARVAPGFCKALAVHLVETSPALQEVQHQALSRLGVAIQWHKTLAEVPDGPGVVVANEFFDALPVRQAVKTEKGWHERVVDVDDFGHLAFAIAPEPIPAFAESVPSRVRNAGLGAIYEWRSDDAALALARRVVKDGAALVIDYGHVQSGIGDTFQAVRAHRFADALAAPGAVDLTAHVDFEALGRAAEGAGARVYGPVEQAVFLRRFGIETRAAALKAAAPAKAAEIDAALARLTTAGPTGMGTLFKAIGFAQPRLGMLPGFDPCP